jgi:hypothetical protein
MGPAAISVLMLLAFAGFTLLAWRKLRIVAALQPEARFDRRSSVCAASSSTVSCSAGWCAASGGPA